MRAIFCLMVIGFGFMTFGCTPPKRDFIGKSTVERVDGVVTNVRVVLPGKSSEQTAEFNLQSREQLNQLIDSLESLALDLKNARDQMAVIEPKK
jgi:hypothetical protein